MIHTPHRDKSAAPSARGLVKEQRFPEEKVLIDHNTEETLPWCWPLLLGRALHLPAHQDGRGAHGGAGQAVRHRPHPGEQRRDWGVSDALKSPDGRGHACRRASRGGHREGGLGQPARLLRPGGRIDVAAHRRATGIDQTEKFEGNSVLRGGQAPWCVRRTALAPHAVLDASA